LRQLRGQRKKTVSSEGINDCNGSGDNKSSEGSKISTDSGDCEGSKDGADSKSKKQEPQ
jgi:hypothetical protein